MPRSILKPHASLFATVLRASDPAVTVLVGLLAYVAYLEVFPLPENYGLFLVAGALVVAALFPMFRLYDPQRGVSLFEEMRQLVLAWLLVAAMVGGTIFATKTGESFSRVWVALWLGGGFVTTVVLRVTVRVILRALRRRGLNLRHVAIIGAGALGERIVQRLGEASWTGYRVAGLYDDDPAKAGTRVAGCPVLGLPDDLVRAA